MPIARTEFKRRGPVFTVSWAELVSEGERCQEIRAVTLFVTFSRVVFVRAESSIEKLVLDNVNLIAEIEKASKTSRTFGERVADLVAQFVGSWPFILGQSLILAIWVCLNVLGWAYEWDPYPFILLNLMLSFQAAYASPIIMMSQNRQAKLNERRNRLDLQINLLAEQENTQTLKLLRLLCERLNIKLNEMEATLEQPINPETVLRQIDEKSETPDDQHCKGG
jgi:uncharacterized membrane protein